VYYTHVVGIWKDRLKKKEPEMNHLGFHFFDALFIYGAVS